MKTNRIFLLLLLLLLNTACNYMPKLDQVIPDRRTEYKKSEAMPDLEVPPDLTAKTDTDPLVIPNEEATTLTQYENQKRMRHGAAGAPTGAEGDEQWLSVQGGVGDIWPRLQTFLEGKGYALDLNDKELGVIETQWHDLEQEGLASARVKLSIFAEDGTAPDSTVLYLSSQKQEKVAGKDGKGNWVDVENNVDFDKQMIGELNLQFYGKQAPAGTSSIAKAAGSSSSSGSSSTTASASRKAKAELQNLGDNKVFLSVPEEFNRAWSLTESAILDAGMYIDSKDRTKGLYFVTYSGSGEQKKSGLFSKLKFWGKKQETKAYQISLTGVGEKTELVVLNDKGDWVSQEEATRILTLLQGQYNVGH